MNRKNILKRKQKRYEEKRAELVKRSNESEDVNEVRAIHEQLQDIAEELRDIADELSTLDENEEGQGEAGQDEAGEKEGRSTDPDVPSGAEIRGGQIVGAFRQTQSMNTDNEEIDQTDTKEYRTAFMEFVCRGVPIPENIKVDVPQLRANEVTTTTDTSAVIPTTLMNKIVEKMETYGNVWARVTKTNIQGGVEIPILILKPEATWIGESKSSDDKKVKADEKISFSYYGIECKIAQTLLANVVTLTIFQSKFVELSAEAIIKGIEKAIFVGSGSGQPTGILKDTRVPKENIITMKPEDMTWEGWHKKVKAKMKKAYRNGQFYMSQGTWDGTINGMVDTTGQPIARVNYGIDGKEISRFMGKEVETVEEEILQDYENAKTGDVFAVFINMSDYVVNSNLQMQTVKWTDNDSNQVKNKNIMICDGKLVDPNGVLIIKKGAATTSTSTNTPTTPTTQQ